MRNLNNRGQQCRTKAFHKFLALLCLLLVGSTSWATDYVFMNGSNFLGQTTAATTDFVPNASIYAGSSGSKFQNANGYYLQFNNNGTLKFTTYSSYASTWTINNNNQIYYKNGNNYYYILLYENNWYSYKSNNNCATAYTVTTQTLTAGTTYSDFTISGDEYISSIGTNNSYNHTNSKVDAACTTYTFNSLTYYSTNPANAASTTRPQTEVTTGYAWSLSANATPYASVDRSTGEITVTSLPDTDVVMTLKCTVGTKTATKQVTLTKAIPVAAGYVIYDGNNHYLGGTRTTAITSFDPNTCLWTKDGNKFKNSSNYYLTLYGSLGLNSNRNSNGSDLTFSGTESGTTGQKVYYDGYNDYYLRYYNNNWTYTNTSSNSGTNVVFSVIKREYNGTDNTIAPTISAALNSDNSGIQFSHTDVSGTYAPAYTDYIFYNNTHHYWYNNASHTSAPSSVDFSTTNATYKWSITSGGTYASIDENSGLLTRNGVATNEQTVTVTLTTTEATSGYSYTKEYTVKIQYYAATSNTVISNLEVDPENGADLDYNASATYTASATATQTDVAAYTKYIFNGNTYWCIAGNSTSFTSENACRTAATTTTSPAVTYAWSLTGDGNAYLSKTDNGATTTVTHSTPNVTTSDVSSMLNVTASANEQSATLANSIQITAKYPRIDPTAVNITSPNPMTLRVGETKTITYTLTPFPCYNSIRCNISEAGIIDLVTMGESGMVNVTGQRRGGLDVTVTARNQDGSDGPYAVVHINVHEKIATPVITFAPTESDNGNTASTTITCSTTGANIYYTTDGSTPTTSSTLYNGAFSVNDQDVVKAIAVMPSTATDYEYYDPSDVATSQYSKCFSATPTIVINGNSVTFTSPDDNATFYYTTDGTTPTTSSTSWTSGSTAITGIANEATIKVIAKHGTCQPSDVVSRTYIAPSGVNEDDGVVTLNDLEDHTWTYYAGVPTDVDGGNYNTNYAGKLYSPDPRNVKITYKGNGQLANGTAVTGVKVGIDADASTFVYYKTIENNNGYKYTTIPNPFSVRPKIGSTYYGFSSWKVKSITGGTITGKEEGSTINAETEITFVPNSTYTTNCISMEVELEAVWDVAEVITSGSFTQNYNSVERNFYIVSNATGYDLPVIGTPCTYTSFYPNGTTDGSTEATMDNRNTRRGNFTCTADTKVEYLILAYNNNGTINADAHNLTIGRGCSPTSGTSSNQLSGMNGKSSIESPKFSLRIESGSYNYMSFYGGYYTNNGGNGGSNSTISGSEANLKVTMGSDYDRAAGVNTNLNMKYAMTFGRSCSFSSKSNRNNLHTLDLTLKSGKLGTTFFMENTTTANYLQGGAGYGHYMSSGGSQTNVGCRNILIEGGEFCTIGSGIDAYNNGGDNNDTYDGTNKGRLAFNVRIKGGIVHGNIYGGAAKSPAGGNRVMVVTGGQVKGWFAAGCNGTDSDGGQTYGTSWVYIGGTGRIDSEGSTKKLGYASGGNVYAAGAGMTGAATCGEMTYGTNLVIADNSYIERGIYGGGNYGYALASTNIYITGGTNEGNTDTQAGNAKGGVYGGANQQNGPEIKIWMTGGKMLGGVYGGCNTKGTISGSVTMQINGGQVGTSTTPANIHGGGYGENTTVSQNVDITLGKTGAARNADGVVVYGDVYGGSALGSVNGTSATNTYHTNVTMNAGTIHGSLYGGALGATGTAANVYGPVTVKVYGGSVLKTDANGANGSGAVYGANNINGAPLRAVTVDIYGTNSAPEGEYALYSVYGGGNKADYTYGNGYPKVTVHNCDNSIEYVYGGGNAAAVAATDVTIYGGNTIGNVFGGGNGLVTAANVTGNTSVKIYGGTIGNVFGGSNSQGNIGGNINLTIEGKAEAEGGEACPMNLTNVYGGGNKASSNPGSITVKCFDGRIENIYGGANDADINGNITLTIQGGNFGRIFGGNNTGHTVKGNVTVNVTKALTCDLNVDYVYGGGNAAAVGENGDTRQVSVTVGGGAHVNNMVFGGGLGETAILNGNTHVQIKGSGTRVDGNVYGGGNGAKVTGNTDVIIGE